MLISPFTPLWFGTRKSDGMESRHMQIFAPSDRILVQVINPTPLLRVGFQIECEDGTILPMTPLEFSIGDSVLSEIEISGLPDGAYRVNIPTIGTSSNWFEVTSDEGVLSRTTLIQYSMKDNRQRTDAVFVAEGMRRFFDFRVPGGFRDAGWSFGIDNEQFTTSSADIVELYALESTQKAFTMGWQGGVPVWFGEKLNRLLTCTYVYFDGVRYARKDSSVPEMTQVIEGLDSFVFTQQVQQVTNLDPAIETSNRLIMRRVDPASYRTTSSDSNINRIIN